MVAEILRSLVHASLGLTVALVLVFLLRAPARRAGGAFLTYVLWAIVPVAISVSLLPAPQIVVTAAPASARVAAAPSTGAVAVPAVAAPLSMNWWLLPWVAGVGVCFGWLVWQQRRFVRSMGALRALDADAWLAERGEGCPAVVGLLPPRLVLPHDFNERYGAQERELILAHERVHLARGDAYANAAAAFLRCLFWFHPLMHIAVARFRQDQELACDAAVLQRFPRARRAYAEAMLKTQLADLGLPVGCHWQSSQPLRERILMLKNPLPGMARRTVGVAVVAALALGGGYAAWAAQPAVPVAAATLAAATPAATPASSAELRVAKLPAASHSAAAPSKPVASATPVTPKPTPRTVAAAAPEVASPALATPAPVQAESSIVKAATEEVSFRTSNAPIYPPVAIRENFGAKVLLRVQVLSDGTPGNVELETIDLQDDPLHKRTLPTTEFGRKTVAEAITQSSMAAVKSWRFNPAKRDGQPVEGWVSVPFTFTLTGGGT
jgi:beta-lactamase regulating signal transducer with metallopeptidase domain